MGGYTSKPALKKPVICPEEADTVVCNFNVTAGGSKSIKIDCIIGEAAGGNLTLQDSSGLSLWNDVKSVSVSASTDKAASFSGSTVTSTAHGFSYGDAVVFNSSGELPAPLEAGRIYFVLPLTANTFQVQPAFNNSIPITFTTTGSGSHTVTLTTVATITVQATDPDDLVYTPLRSVARIVGEMDEGDGVQVVGILVSQEY